MTTFRQQYRSARRKLIACIVTALLISLPVLTGLYTEEMLFAIMVVNGLLGWKIGGEYNKMTEAKDYLIFDTFLQDLK